MTELIKRDFQSLEEAFKALPDETARHSKRVGAYAVTLFFEACADSIYFGDPKADARLKEDYGEIAELMGRYHDLGKALVPEFYHSERGDFSDEERALYQRHGRDSADLIAKYLNVNKDYKAFEVNCVKEALIWHHESWDGSGFPDHLEGTNIPLFARLVAVADKFDHLICSIHSENPFEDAVETINELAESQLDPEIVSLIPECFGKLKKIYKSDVPATRTIPKAKMVIERTEHRPFGLFYRPVSDRETGKTVACEAKIMFRHGESDWQEYEPNEYLIVRENLKEQLGVYMVIEACDTLKRFENCGFGYDYIALNMPGDWMMRRGASKDIKDAIKDMQADPAKLCFVFGNKEFEAKSKAVAENFAKLRAFGCQVMCSGILPVADNPEKVMTFGTSIYRMETNALEEIESDETYEFLKFMKEAGVALVADGLEREKDKKLLTDLGIYRATGPITGGYFSEDGFVITELSNEEG